MAVSITIVIDQNSQSIANNTSNVTVKVNASWTGGSYNLNSKSGWLKIDGTTYTFSSSFNDKRTTSGVKTLYTKTVDVKHDSDGTKDLACSASYTSGVSSGTVGASATVKLDTIPRKSSMSVSNGTLGTSQTITVTQKASSFTHSIKAVCGSSTVYIKADGSTQSSESKHSDTSIPFTPPISWAGQNTTGTSVSVKYTITTYSGSTNVGTNTYTISYSIPASVKPSCKLSVSDATSHYNTYGTFVKGLSKFKISITPTTSYGSAIASYRTTADGTTYTSSSFTTDVLKSSGTLTISTTVTDKRGRSGTASSKYSVLNYSAPSISKLSVKRSDENGVDNDQGEYVQVSFNAAVTDLKGINVPKYVIRYKRVSDSAYTEVELTSLNKTFSVSNGTYVFPAESGSSYDVELVVGDSHNTTRRATTASTAFTIMHWNAVGNGMGIGKLSELQGVFDIGMQTRLLGGLLYVLLPAETDLNACYTPGFYMGENVSTYKYANCPLSSGTFTLEILSMGDNGQLMQRLTQCHISAPVVYERTYYKSAGWGEWFGGWVYPTIGSEFAVYASDGVGNKPCCRKDGRTVEVRGIVKPVNDIAGGTDMHTIITVPVGYRPNMPIYTVCQGSGNCTWLLRVNTDGSVALSRYRNGDTTTTASAGAWLPFQITYLV